MSWNRALLHVMGGYELRTDVMRGTRGWYQGCFCGGELGREDSVSIARIRGTSVRIGRSIEEVVLTVRRAGIPSTDSGKRIAEVNEMKGSKKHENEVSVIGNRSRMRIQVKKRGCRQAGWTA